jgi:gluconokinase
MRSVTLPRLLKQRMLSYKREKRMIVLVMGVAGAGKTTIGRMLAERLGWVYLEADDFHSEANKAKMSRGEHLTEADRLPWLEAMHAELQIQSAKGKNVVLACSALNEEYRGILMAGLEVKLVYLRGSKELIASRLQHRTGHFAGVAILDDQFAVLEEPRNAIVADVAEAPEKIVEEVLARIA